MAKPDPKPDDLDVILARMDELEILLLSLKLLIEALKTQVEEIETGTGGHIRFG